MAWKVVCEVQGKNPDVPTVSKDRPQDTGRNVGALVIQLKNLSGGYAQEIARVAFIRRNSKNPDTPFEEQLGSEIQKAHQLVGLLNEQEEGALL